MLFLDFFFLTLVLFLQCLSIHFQVLIGLFSQFWFTFPQIQKFHYTDFDYSCADRQHLCVYLRNVPCSHSFKIWLLLTSFTCRRIQVGINLYFPDKYQFKSHYSPLFSAACAASMTHGNRFFHISQQDWPSVLRMKRLVVAAKVLLRLPSLLWH